MTAIRKILLCCDEEICKANLLVDDVSLIRAARSNAALWGWTTHDNKDYCPRHHEMAGERHYRRGRK